jgi:hypothetical protein
MQPLDVGCFGPLQTAWFNKCNEILDLTGEGMEMKDVVREYFAARHMSFKPETISQAWRKSGICLLNPSIFKQVDFAPSQTTSTSFHVPASFPTRMPHAPEASSADANFGPAFWNAESHEEDEAGGSESESDSDSESSKGPDSGEECGDYTIDPNDFPLFPDTPLATDQSSANASVGESASALTELQLAPARGWPGWASRANVTIASPTTLRQISESGALAGFSHRTRSHRASPASTVSTVSSFSPASTPATPPPCTFNNSTAISMQLAAANAKILALTEEVAFVSGQRDGAEVHAIMAMCEATCYKCYLNSKKKSKDTTDATSARRFHTSSRVVTNDQGLDDAWEDRRKQNAAKKKKDDCIMKKAAKEREDLRRRVVEGSTRVFSGTLNSMNKTELEDLADALDLPIDGKKEDEAVDHELLQ